MKGIFIPLLIFFSLPILAQEQSVESLFRVNYDTPLTIDLEEEELEENQLDPSERIEKEEKKHPRDFWGKRTKRGHIKVRVRGSVVTETFHYLKKKDMEGIQPGEYDQDFYYFDFKKRRIVNSRRIPDHRIGILHGHYEKKLDNDEEQLLEEGYFYKGQKHKRWIRLNSSDILIDKTVFWKGYPEESRLAFYDPQREKLKEAIPVIFGEREGDYYAFYPDGEIAVTGKYVHDYRVGMWREYHPNNKVKREIRYPENPFETKASPVILREYDREGQLVYDRERFVRRIKQ
jgi:antitoxin component YwqK of YwqJK toxin-antitoxin module